MHRLMGSGTTRGAQRMSSEPVGSEDDGARPRGRDRWIARRADRRPGIARCRGDPRRGGRRPRRARLAVPVVRRHGRRPDRRRTGAARPRRPSRCGGGDRRQRWRRRRLAADQDLRDLLDRRPGARRVARLRRHGVRRARAWWRSPAPSPSLTRVRDATPRARLGVPAVAIGAITVVAMMSGATHVHSHDDTHRRRGRSRRDRSRRPRPLRRRRRLDATTVTRPSDHAATDAAAWPRPWDPAAPIDFSGVPGVTAEQQARAEALAASTIAELPQFADVSTLAAAGFLSIGDAGTGFEHFINPRFIVDDHFLDPTRPESLVYAVDGEERTLVSAMFIAKDLAVDDPELVDWGGPLMQWHVHENLCWASTRTASRRSSASPTTPATARPARSTPAARSRWSTSGSPPTSAARSPPSKATVPGRSATDRRPRRPVRPRPRGGRRGAAGHRSPTTRRSRSTCPASRASRPSSRRTPRTSSP